MIVCPHLQGTVTTPASHCSRLGSVFPTHSSTYPRQQPLFGVPVASVLSSTTENTVMTCSRILCVRHEGTFLGVGHHACETFPSPLSMALLHAEQAVANTHLCHFNHSCACMFLATNMRMLCQLCLCLNICKVCGGGHEHWPDGWCVRCQTVLWQIFLTNVSHFGPFWATSNPFYIQNM